MENKKNYSTTEVAQLLGISRIAVFQKIQKGDIKAKKVGRNYVISHKEVAHLLPHTLSPSNKKQIEKAVRRTMKDFGETLKLLGKE